MDDFTISNWEILSSVFSDFGSFMRCFLLALAIIGICLLVLDVCLIRLYVSRRHQDDSRIMLYCAVSIVSGVWLLAGLYLGTWSGALMSFRGKVEAMLHAADGALAADGLGHAYIVAGHLNELRFKPVSEVSALIQADLSRYDSVGQLPLRKCLGAIGALEGHGEDIMAALQGESELVEQLGADLDALEELGHWYHGFAELGIAEGHGAAEGADLLESRFPLFPTYCRAFDRHLADVSAGEGMVSSGDLRRLQVDFMIGELVLPYLWRHFLAASAKAILLALAFSLVGFGVLLAGTRRQHA